MTKRIESTYCPERREWNLLIRRPFYLNLRLGGTQNALWVGGPDMRGTRNVFNWFVTPWSAYSTTFGHVSRATLLAEVRRINVKLNGVVKEPVPR